MSKEKFILPVIIWSVVVLVTLGISHWSGLSFWVMLPIVVVAVLINGFVATFEDDLPGGFNNPDGTQTPRYAQITGKIVRGVLVVFVLLCIVVLSFWAWG